MDTHIGNVLYGRWNMRYFSSVILKLGIFIDP